MRQQQRQPGCWLDHEKTVATSEFQTFAEGRGAARPQRRHLGRLKFTGQDVLRGVSIQVPTGSIYGFLGPNGAGKTTTLRLILGLLRKQKGDVSLFGKRFENHRIVGSLIESPSLYDQLSAAENLKVLQVIRRCPESRIRDAIAGVKRLPATMRVDAKLRFRLSHSLSKEWRNEAFMGIAPGSTRFL